MHILIAGSPQSGQREVLELLTGKQCNEPALSGLVTRHEFVTKYFSAPCGLWIDEISDYAEWVREFSSPEAQEVRDSLVLFIYTYTPASPDHLSAAVTELAKFTDTLPPGASVAVAMPPATLPPTSQHPSTQISHILVEAGFDMMERDELVSTVHSALYDAQSGRSGESSEDEDDSNARNPRPPRELNEIVAELVKARDSDTMTDDEKRALAERLASELTM